MRSKGLIAFSILFLLLLLVTVTAAAEDSLRVRSCRPSGPPSGSPRGGRALTSSPLGGSRRGGHASYVGNRRQLVILVSFSDQRFLEADPLPLWHRVFNEEHFSESPFRGSVHDYFVDQSDGRFRLTFDLQYVHSQEERQKYRSTAYDDENSALLVSDLVDTLRTRDVDWDAYDWNADGYVDQLLIIYAGKGQNAGGGSNTIWPHQWWLSQHKGGKALTVTSGGSEYKVDSYCCVQELSSDGSYGSFGTICHEYSHCFGFPDLYSNVSYVHAWDLMDYGNNNGGGFCPPNYSALERMLVGWLDPTELNAPATVDGMAAGEAYIVRNDGWADEFYMVENRQQLGWDAALPGSGIVIAHVDYDQELWEGITGLVNFSSHQHYTIFPANNSTSRSRIDGWAYPYGGNASLTNTSAPAATLLNANADGTYFMSKPITNITVDGGLASFDFMKDAPDGISVQTRGKGQTRVFSPQGYQLAGDIGQQPAGLYIVVGSDGTTRKIVKR